MNKEQKIGLARSVSRSISLHLTDVWPGFVPVPFILYDDGEQVAVGDAWPPHYVHAGNGIWTAEGTDPQLMGNTSLMYHGVRVAVWDTRTWPDNVDTEQAVSGIAHEMFHAYQYDHMRLPWANELLMPQYPHSPRSVALVIAENKRLLDMLDSHGVNATACFSDISDMRRQREAEIGAEYMEYDKRCESAEGTAAYVELRMKAAVAGTDLDAEAYLSLLKDEERLLARYRHRCYAAGLALCLAADMLCPGWQALWQGSKMNIFDWLYAHVYRAKTPHNTQTAKSPHATELSHAAALLGTHKTEQEQRIDAFLKLPLTSLEGAVKLLGFDPMNLVCTGNRCLHAHGMLRLGTLEYMAETPFLTEYGKNLMDVKRILLPAAASYDESAGVIKIEGIGDMRGHIGQSGNDVRFVVA